MLYLVPKPRYCIGTGTKTFKKIPGPTFNRTQSIILKMKQTHKNSYLNTLDGTGKVRMAAEFLLMLCKDYFGTSWMPACCVLEGKLVLF